MERLDPTLDRLRTFALSPPVACGAPICALVGLLAGFALRTGPQDAGFTPQMEPARPQLEAVAEPTAWPAGNTPDYVVGTDFIQATRAPPVQMVAYAPSDALPPAPDMPPYTPGRHGPATPPPDPDSYGAASRDGDILNVSLPEDRKPGVTALTMADAAATGMTAR